MKKIFLLGLIMGISLISFGCGSSDKNDKEKNNEKKQEQIKEENQEKVELEQKEKEQKEKEELERKQKEKEQKERKEELEKKEKEKNNKKPKLNLTEDEIYQKFIKCANLKEAIEVYNSFSKKYPHFWESNEYDDELLILDTAYSRAIEYFTEKGLV